MTGDVNQKRRIRNESVRLFFGTPSPECGALRRDPCEFMTSDVNERKACDAVLRVLEQRSGHRRAELRFPEEDGRGPPVDLRVRLGNREYAFEHTRIEPFTHYIRTGTRFSQLVRPIEEALEGTLPGPAEYVLRFPLDPSLHASGARFTAQVTALIGCIRTEAAFLYQRTLAAHASRPCNRPDDRSLGRCRGGHGWSRTGSA